MQFYLFIYNNLKTQEHIFLFIAYLILFKIIA